MNSVSTGILFVFVLLLLLTIGIRIREGTWYSPFALMGLLWTFIIGFSLYTAPEYFFSVSALGFITINIFVFYAGGIIAENIYRIKSPRPLQVNPEKILYLHYYVSVAAGFLALYFLLSDAGVNMGELLTGGKFMDTSKMLTNNRYEGERLSGHAMLCLMTCYSGCLTAGRLFVTERMRWKQLRTLIILFPLLLFTLIYTARAILIFAMLLFVSSLIATYLLRFKKNTLLFSKRKLLVMLAACVVMPMIFLFTQAIRMGISKFSLDSFAIVMDHLKVYFSGNLSAFSYWFAEPGKNAPLTMGGYTFAGLSEWIGGGTRELGIYGKAIDLDGHMQFSNIYTLFRFLIDDFGITGTFIFWFVLGIGCRIIYNKVLSEDYVAAAVLCGIVTWILFSFVTSIFAYNSVLFAWLIFVLITYAAEKFSGSFLAENKMYAKET